MYTSEAGAMLLPPRMAVPAVSVTVGRLVGPTPAHQLDLASVSRVIII